MRWESELDAVVSEVVEEVGFAEVGAGLESTPGAGRTTAVAVVLDGQ